MNITTRNYPKRNTTSSQDDTTTIQTTTNYDQFSLLGANREQTRGHVESLKRAFEEKGNLTRVQPILVNENMEIIDGQHRFTACQELGQPIHYTVVPGLRVSDARAINVLHKGWTVDDYARSYAITGDKNYQKYLELREDYGFPHSVTLIYAIGQYENRIYKDFREGNFVLEDEVATRERLEKLVSVGQFAEMVKDKKFAIALLKASQVEGYDHQRMLSKLETAQHLLRRFGTQTEYMKMLEEVYNYKTREGNQLRLY